MKDVTLSSSVDSFRHFFEEKNIRVFSLSDRKICVAKHASGFFAFEPLCPHQRHPLKEAKINAFGEVICPLHFYRFELSTGKSSNMTCSDLEVYKIEILENQVVVKLPY